MNMRQECELFPAVASEREAAADVLLLAAMDRLQIDRATLASESPTVMRQLQARCAACRSRDVCAHDTGRFPDGADRWHAYCPNSAELATIGAAQNCGWAGQYLRRGDLVAPGC